MSTTASRLSFFQLLRAGLGSGLTAGLTSGSGIQLMLQTEDRDRRRDDPKGAGEKRIGIKALAHSAEASRPPQR